MQNPRRHSRKETTQQAQMQPHELQRVLSAMVKMSSRVGKPFSEARMDQMCQDLASYPVDSIEWAMDSWGRNSRVLPALDDIIKLLRTWVTAIQPEARCEPECQSRHGKGYDFNDVMWLWKKRRASEKKWTDADYAGALAELDRLRQGGAPAWRT